MIKRVETDALCWLSIRSLSLKGVLECFRAKHEVGSGGEDVVTAESGVVTLVIHLEWMPMCLLLKNKLLVHFLFAEF